MQCQCCGSRDETIRKSRAIPAGVVPITRCGCAMLCKTCREIGMAQYAERWAKAHEIPTP